MKVWVVAWVTWDVHENEAVFASESDAKDYVEQQPLAKQTDEAGFSIEEFDIQ